MSLADFIPEKFLELFSDPDFSKAIKGYNLYLIKEDPEYRSEVKTYFDMCLVTSELKPIKRIAELETVTGLNDYSDFEDEEDHAPSIPEQIKELAHKIENQVEKFPEPIKTEVAIIPHTTLERKACAFVEHLKTAIKPRNGEIFLKNNESIHFLKNEIDEELRIRDIKNPRQAKKDIIEKAAKMFPFIVLDKRKQGNKDVRVIYKPENDRYTHNRMDSYIRLKSSAV
jgi:hypothetical protein